MSYINPSVIPFNLSIKRDPGELQSSPQLGDTFLPPLSHFCWLETESKKSQQRVMQTHAKGIRITYSS